METAEILVGSVAGMPVDMVPDEIKPQSVEVIDEVVSIESVSAAASGVVVMAEDRNADNKQDSAEVEDEDEEDDEDEDDDDDDDDDDEEGSASNA